MAVIWNDLMDISKLVILPDNKYYRIGDILSHSGHRWKADAQHILDNSAVYENTLLYKYLARVHTFDKPISSFAAIIKEYVKENNVLLPDADELVIHLRLGDVMKPAGDRVQRRRKATNRLVSTFVTDHNVDSPDRSYNKVSIVTALHFGNNTDIKKDGGWYAYSDESRDNSVAALEALAKSIEAVDLPVNLVSNENIDLDFCYCIFAKHLVAVHQSGFFKIILAVRKELGMNS